MHTRNNPARRSDVRTSLSGAGKDTAGGTAGTVPAFTSETWRLQELKPWEMVIGFSILKSAYTTNWRRASGGRMGIGFRCGMVN